MRCLGFCPFRTRARGGGPGGVPWEQGMVQDVKDEQLEDWQSGTYFFRPAADFDDE